MVFPEQLLKRHARIKAGQSDLHMSTDPNERILRVAFGPALKFVFGFQPQNDTMVLTICSVGRQASANSVQGQPELNVWPLRESSNYPTSWPFWVWLVLLLPHVGGS